MQTGLNVRYWVVLNSQMLNILHLTVPLLQYGKEEKYCITFDVLKVLINAPKEHKNDLVEATFYGSHLKQSHAEHTAFECHFCCYIMAMRGEILYHI